MKIVVDAMGGDFAPRSPVKGALIASEKLPSHVEIILVGQEEVVCPLLAGQHDGKRISVVHASQLVYAHDIPSDVLRMKTDSSMMVGLTICKEKRADAFVSAGSTGAQMAASLMILGRLPGVLRPTIGTLFPNINNNKTVLIDAGANVDSKPQQIVQVAQMASIYLRTLWNVGNPSVGLVNIGEEETKGTELVKQYYAALKQAHNEGKINFYGNIEGRDIMFDVVNIALCDGFTGNVILKYAESIPKFVSAVLNKPLSNKVASGVMTEEQAHEISETIEMALDDFNDEKYGGLPLLGINGVSVVCHGKSSPMAIARAICLASEMVEKKVNELIKL